MALDEHSSETSGRVTTPGHEEARLIAAGSMESNEGLVKRTDAVSSSELVTRSVVSFRVVDVRPCPPRRIPF